MDVLGCCGERGRGSRLLPLRWLTPCHIRTEAIMATHQPLMEIDLSKCPLVLFGSLCTSMQKLLSEEDTIAAVRGYAPCFLLVPVTRSPLLHKLHDIRSVASG